MKLNNQQRCRRCHNQLDMYKLKLSSSTMRRRIINSKTCSRITWAEWMEWIQSNSCANNNKWWSTTKSNVSIKPSTAHQAAVSTTLEVNICKVTFTGSNSSQRITSRINHCCRIQTNMEANSNTDHLSNRHHNWLQKNAKLLMLYVPKEILKDRKGKRQKKRKRKWAVLALVKFTSAKLEST